MVTKSSLSVVVFVCNVISLLVYLSVTGFFSARITCTCSVVSLRGKNTAIRATCKKDFVLLGLRVYTFNMTSIVKNIDFGGFLLYALSEASFVQFVLCRQFL